ncbi:MAG: bifunctional phosphopantothenoylcysteine decarboxylase/phosphopantothenate--cysteine ligase CoaBC, partial [Muribaculaceae bacterium]|nr:bifunctional phosphopantothenoylcysteine decarboxylase/phosphopantothenate--cysteine ligase CoaBC [Muribaculaceae bacterium]
MEKYLAGKHIVLGITGGIAAYKSAMLLRLMIKAGAEVQVVMTPSAKEFITPVTLSALSGKPVVSEFFTANSGEWHSHVDLGLWADAMVIAPATACTIGKMANGVADNMLVTTYLSSKARVFVAPAMDLDMMAHPSTVENLRRLRSYGNIIIEPAEGELASHLIGKGRMEEPENILKVLEDYFRRQVSPSPLTGKKVLVTAGPTREKIDPVRYISNYSTGKMAYAIADELASRGADVTVVSGPVSVNASEPSVEVIGVESGREMAAACEARFRDADIAVMCAAVADYTVENPSEVKLKREGNLPPEIKLVKNPDIARMLGEMKAPGQMLVGFALETDNEADNALDKMERKNLDMIVLNSLRDKGAGFATDTNKVTVFI